MKAFRRMKSGADFTSSAKSIHLISLQSTIPSREQKFERIIDSSSGRTEHLEVKLVPSSTYDQWLPVIPSLVTSLVAVLVAYLVHKLTRQREREKAVYDLHKLLIDAVKEVRKAAALGWTTTCEKERETAIHDHNWNLQRVGAQAQLIYLQSGSSHWFFWEYRIVLTKNVSSLRDALTLGDFSSINRSADPTQVASVDDAIVIFMSSVDRQLIQWTERSKHSIKLKNFIADSSFYKFSCRLVDFFYPVSCAMR